MIDDLIMTEADTMKLLGLEKPNSLTMLVTRGLPYTEIPGGKRIFLFSSIVAWFKEQEQKEEDNGI